MSSNLPPWRLESHCIHTDDFLIHNSTIDAVVNDKAFHVSPFDDTVAFYQHLYWEKGDNVPRWSISGTNRAPVTLQVL